MREFSLKAKASKRYKVTTDSRHSFPVAANLLDRKFDVDKPDTVWTTDITYVWTFEGWLYLAVVLDLYSRQIVGWAMGKRIKKQLAIDALAMAYWRRKPPSGLLHHSDRGSQYACHDYQKRTVWYGGQYEPQGQLLGQCSNRTGFPKPEIGTIIGLQVCYQKIS